MCALTDRIVTHTCHIIDVCDRIQRGSASPRRLRVYETCANVVAAMQPICAVHAHSPPSVKCFVCLFFNLSLCFSLSLLTFIFVFLCS